MAVYTMFVKHFRSKLAAEVVYVVLVNDSGTQPCFARQLAHAASLLPRSGWRVAWRASGGINTVPLLFKYLLSTQVLSVLSPPIFFLAVGFLAFGSPANQTTNTKKEGHRARGIDH